jgi:hypothetical protein
VRDDTTDLWFCDVHEIFLCVERPRVAKPELGDDVKRLLGVTHVDHSHLDQNVVGVGLGVLLSGR